MNKEMSKTLSQVLLTHPEFEKALSDYLEALVEYKNLHK